MEISGISVTAGQMNFSATSGSRSTPATVDQGHAVRETRAKETDGSKEIRGAREHHHGKGHKGRGLAIFRQEMRMAMRSNFHARFATEHSAYARNQSPQTADQVADEALGAARQVASESPVTAAKAMITFRSKVHESASYVRETVGAQEDLRDVEDAVAKVDEGLDSLENEVAGNRESTASVLAVDSRVRQRSSIRIRTQEGDVVKLSLRRAETMSATDVSNSDGESSATSTEVSVSSRSRLMLRVDGDLNDNELAAIRNVFSQAEQMADEFFGGDIGAAFNLAEGFDFDSGQLARVKMNFRMHQMSNVSYSETLTTAPAIAATVPIAPEAIPVAPVETGTVDAVPTDDAAPVVDAETTTDVSETAVESDNAVADTASPGDVMPEPFALSGFLESLSTFLRSVSEGFSANSSNGSFSYFYAESFKLELLSAVFNTVAPDDADVAAVAAGQIIDSVAEDASEQVA